MPSSEKLKTCPFCGTANVHFGDRQYGHTIFCDDCGAHGPMAYDEKGANELWNNRTGVLFPVLSALRRFRSLAMRDYKTIRIQIKGLCDSSAINACQEAEAELSDAIKHGWDIMYSEDESIWKIYHLVKDRESE